MISPSKEETMRRVTIAVIGNAKSTRANVEALITDMADAMDSVALATVYKDKQSDGQIWAEQLAQDKSIPWVAYDKNDYKTLLKEHKDNEIKFFILWDDEDPECQLAASVAQENSIIAYDLTNGLMQIPFSSSTIQKPAVTEIPEIETQVSAEPVEPQLSQGSGSRRVVLDVGEAVATLIEGALASDDAEEEPEEELDESEEDETWDLGELLENAIEEAARHFARSFADEFKKIIGK
jgi:hypothetical protein